MFRPTIGQLYQSAESAAVSITIFNSCCVSVFKFGFRFSSFVFGFRKLYQNFCKALTPRMVRFESDPDNDSAVSEAITDYFCRNPEDLMEDGSRPTVLLLAREKNDAGTFRQFLWWTLITVAIFAVIAVFFQSVIDKIGMLTSQWLITD